ncbi:MAG: sugar ABC transporter substrate-binding protein [Micrococcales bacterium 73-15]|uniref:ABC transporter substrate-binding protein n=1 Tax=Salana multivorans TaxID=120377 RepID=UPI000960A787|nr:ABC transporter substrate-binding protein [Salana multivorans]OJX96924.1 MAG: sugar ABC transporter substrate-binding protein [Micrococcales bacterium 73-15]
MNRMHRGAIVGVCAAAITLTACSGGGSTPEDADGSAAESVGFKVEGLPIVEDSVTLTFSGQKSTLAPDYSTMQLVQEWEADTNVTIEWENLPDSVYQEKKNLLLASGDLPDAFYNTGFSLADISTYGSNGTLIPLEGLIEEYAPNLQAIFEKRPEIKAAVTSSDGHIYTLPQAEELGIGAVPFFLSINKTWLDQLGLEVPETIEEFRAALEAFRDNDMNGNGKDDEIPFSFISDWWCADVGDVMAALGGMPDNLDHRIVRDGKVVYTAAQPEYREAVAQLADWYAEGLIDPEALTQDDKTYLAKGKTEEPTLGAYVWWETEEVVGPDRAADYVLVPALDGVAGPLVGHANGGDYAPGAFAITRANEYPEVTMRWVDRLYEPVMSAQVSWGPIGVTLEENADGVLEQMEMPEGVSAGEYRQKVAPGGPHVVLKEDFVTVVLPEPRASQRLADLEEYYLPAAEPEWYPNVSFSAEESSEIAQIETELKTFVNTQRAEWIAKGGVEEGWDAYESQLKAMGLDRLVELYQTALDRFNAAS